MVKDDLNLTQKRPSMLGYPEYRLKEEKKKMLKMSYKKLQKMDDPETLLCKAVLINNFLKYLHNSSSEISVTYYSEHKKASEEVKEHTDKNIKLLNTNYPSSYHIEDILSEIYFPPPIAPQIEEFTYCKFETKTNEDNINVCDDVQK